VLKNHLDHTYKDTLARIIIDEPSKEPISELKKRRSQSNIRQFERVKITKGNNRRLMRGSFAADYILNKVNFAPRNPYSSQT
jgi:hypothetical protein